MEPWLEIGLIVAFAGVYPAYSVLSKPRVESRLAAGASRVHLYREIIVIQWSAAAAVALLWWMGHRDPATLGLVVPTGWRGLLATGLAAAGSVLLFVQMVGVIRSPKNDEALRGQLGSAAIVIPRSAIELRWFAVVGVTAGIVEELFYRAFLFGFLEARIGALSAAIATTIVFGLGHLYQGIGGAVKTGFVGAVQQGLYILGGSAWPCMLLHAAIDLAGGRMAFEAFRRSKRGGGV
jgi:membrane protease YdiL (CAAX protease family)